MLSSFVTIIIPCKNSLPSIKNSIENLVKQTRIRGTRVMVLDIGSDDGSFQYVAQASSELSKILRIESLNIKDKNKTDFYSEITTPYVLWMCPGSILNSNDFIFDSINNVSRKHDLFLHPPQRGILKNIFANYFLRSGNLSLSCVFCRKEILKKIMYKNELGSFNISIEKSALNNNYKIVKGKTHLYSDGR